MPMSPSVRRELWKLRELTSFLLAGEKCCFCGEAISPAADEFTRHGNATGPVFEGGVTIHHVNGDHEDNRHENKALCHTKCHKSFHRRQMNLERSLRLRLQQETVDLDLEK